MLVILMGKYLLKFDHSIISICHSPPTTSSLQSQDHELFFSACCFYRHALILDILLTFLTVFATLVLKPSFS